MMPCGCRTRSRKVASVVSAIPSPVRSSLPACLSSRRSTTRSPCAVGRIETRTSTERPARRSAMRPSCGWRFSAMSRRAMILMRDTITPCTTCGGSSTSRSIPSLRKRTTERWSKASMWMSDAPSRTACENSALINRTIGASSSLSRRSATLGRLSASAASKASFASSLRASCPPSARCTSASTAARTPGKTQISKPCSSCRALITPWRLAKAYGRRSTQRASGERALEDMSMALLGRRGSGTRFGGCGRFGRGLHGRLARCGARGFRRARTRCVARRFGRYGLHAVVYVFALRALAARVAAQIFITVLRHAITVLDRADDHRPEEDHQVGPLALLALEAEQRAQKRNVAEQRNLLRRHVQGVLDQPAEHDGIAVVHHHLGFDGALVGDEIARAGPRGGVDVRDLLIDLEPDGRALGNLRLDAQGEAHVAALDRLEGIHRRHFCRRRGGHRREPSGDERHVLPDDDFRLVVVQRKEIRR